MTARSSFFAFDSIFLKKPQPHWVSLGKCRWTSPECLQRLVSLRSYYPKLKTLFVDCLKIQAADVNDLTLELYALDSDEKELERTATMLKQCNSYLKQGQKIKDIEAFKKKKLFPTRKGISESEPIEWSNSSKPD